MTEAIATITEAAENLTLRVIVQSANPRSRSSKALMEKAPDFRAIVN